MGGHRRCRGSAAPTPCPREKSVGEATLYLSVSRGDTRSEPPTSTLLHMGVEEGQTNSAESPILLKTQEMCFGGVIQSSATGVRKKYRPGAGASDLASRIRSLTTLAGHHSRAGSAAEAHNLSGIGRRPWCELRQRSKRREILLIPAGTSARALVAIVGPPALSSITTDGYQLPHGGRYACRPKPMIRRNCLSATNSPDPTQRSRWSPPCHGFTFLQTCSTIENADSITLVLASVLRSCINHATGARWLRGGLGPSVLGAMRSSLFGATVVFDGISRVPFSRYRRFLFIRQVIPYISALVNLAVLDRGRLAEIFFHGRT
jgi:hypothetical protein